MTEFKKAEIVKYKSRSKTGVGEANWGRWEQPVTIQEYGAINKIDISPVDPNYFAITSYSKVLVYNPIIKDVFKTLSKFQDAAFGAKFRRDGKLLCVGTSEGQVKIFDIATKTMLRILKGHTTATHRCEFTADNIHVASFSDDKSVGVWDLATETRLDTLNFHTDYVRCGVTAAGSSDLVVSGSYDQTVVVWDRRTKEEPVVKITHGAPVEDVMLLPGDSLLVTAGGSYIKVWDITAGGRMLTSLSPHHKTVTCLCLADGGEAFVSGSLDRQAKRISTSDFSVTGSMSFPSSLLSVAVHPNNNYVVGGMADGLVQIVERSKEKVVDGVTVDSSRERKKRNDSRYLRFTHFTPAPGDIIIDGQRRGHEAKHDTYLRKFEYTKALDSAINPYVQRKSPEVAHTVLYELMRRGGLEIALAGRDEKSLVLLLNYVVKNFTDSRFQGVLIHVANMLVDMYLAKNDNSEGVKKLFNTLERKLERKILYDEEITKLQGCLDLLLATADIGIQSSRIEKELLKAKT